MGHRAHLALVIVPANNMPVYRLKLEEAVESSQSLKLPDGNVKLLVEGIDTMPGADLPVFFQSGDGETVRADVPVLDGTLPYLAPLVP